MCINKIINTPNVHAHSLTLPSLIPTDCGMRAPLLLPAHLTSIIVLAERVILFVIVADFVSVIVLFCQMLEWRAMAWFFHCKWSFSRACQLQGESPLQNFFWTSFGSSPPSRLTCCNDSRSTIYCKGNHDDKGGDYNETLGGYRPRRDGHQWTRQRSESRSLPFFFRSIIDNFFRSIFDDFFLDQ